ncbi:hypothetical protein K7711_17320 [Nocardia sp. CA2R105]|uniref:hypothetical protein n=1 Tax=Nocardia coffeae TaxID=2873381 RepID=UPI001CA7A900|nr:hypothetical protein [Nocardia coffeae]MBY8858245.1 hypothetical protein [Nocardia coffeae]
MIETNTCSVLVHAPAPPGGGPRPAAINLWPGEQAMFGRGSDTRPVDVCLDRPGISRLAGRIEVVDGYWILTNLAGKATATYVVHNDEGRGEHFTIRPGERLPVPFTGSRVELLDAESTVIGFKVFVLRRAAAAIPAAATTTVGRTVNPVRPVDETTKHFLVLVALCAPRMVHGAAAVPTIPELLRQVQRTSTGRDIRTPSAVNFHLEYLVDRLGLRDYNGLEDRRAGLINRALWFGIVREEHLGLLADA